jgi:hypothetical protein
MNNFTLLLADSSLPYHQQQYGDYIYLHCITMYQNVLIVENKPKVSIPLQNIDKSVILRSGYMMYFAAHSSHRRQ